MHTQKETERRNKRGIFQSLIDRDAQALAAFLKLDPRLAAQQDQEGRTPLAVAAGNGDLACVEILLPLGYLDVCDNQGQDALMKAASHGHPQCVRFLLPHFDATRCSQGGHTAFLLAVSGGDVSCLSLLAPVSDVNALNHRGESAIELAIRINDLPILRDLMTRCDWTQPTPDGSSVLQRATGMGRWSCADILACALAVDDPAVLRALRQAPPHTLPQLRARCEREALREALSPSLTHRSPLSLGQDEATASPFPVSESPHGQSPHGDATLNPPGTLSNSHTPANRATPPIGAVAVNPPHTPAPAPAPAGDVKLARSRLRL